MPYHSEHRLRLGPSYFEILIERTAEGTVRIIWYSRRLNLSLSFSLRQEWVVNYGGFEQVSSYIERLVGGTIANFIEMGLSQDSIHRAVEILSPTFDEGIHQFMERVEMEVRRGRTFSRSRDEFIQHYWPARPSCQEEKGNSEAKARATKLLESKLNPDQLSEFRSKKQFMVISKDGNGYRITSARSFNVQGPDGKKYCGQLTDAPVEDQMLAQKILLETDPDKFFKHANVSGGEFSIDQLPETLRRGPEYPEYFARPFNVDLD